MIFGCSDGISGRSQHKSEGIHTYSSEGGTAIVVSQGTGAEGQDSDSFAEELFILETTGNISAQTPVQSETINNK